MNTIAPGVPSLDHEVRIPYVLGCAFMTLICFPALVGLPGGMSIANVIMFAGFPFWFAATVKRKALVLDRTAKFGVGIVMSCLAFLLVWAFVSVLDSSMPDRAGRTLVTLISGFAIFFLVVGTVTRKRLYTFVDVLCLTLAFTCLISFAAYFEPTLGSMIFYGTDRAYGFFKHPNQFAIPISTLLPVATAGLLGQQGRRVIWATCLGALLLGLILTGSKTNLLISSGTLVVICFSYPAIVYTGPQRLFMMALSALATCALLIVNFVLLQAFNPRALRLFQKLASDDEELQSLVARSELWRLSLENFQNDPIFGQGAGHPLNPFYAGKAVTHSHNVLLDYLRTLGAPGFAVLSVMILTVFCLSISSIRLAFSAHGASNRDRILCIGLAMAPLAYVAANLSSDSMGPSTSPFFWTVLFLGLAARLLMRKE